MRAGVYAGPWQDCNVPSRLLLPEIIRRLNVYGAPVAIAPDWNTLLVTGSEDTSGQKFILDFASEASKTATRALAPRPLVLRADEWLDHLPDSGSPLINDYAALRQQALAREYAQQKALLDKLYAKTGVDKFVASFNLMQDEETKMQRSYSIWNRGFPTLLPQSDLIFLVDPEKPKGSNIICKISWDRATELLAGMMCPEGMYPERFSVTAFPGMIPGEIGERIRRLIDRGGHGFMAARDAGFEPAKRRWLSGITDVFLIGGF